MISIYHLDALRKYGLKNHTIQWSVNYRTSVGKQIEDDYDSKGHTVRAVLGGHGACSEGSVIVDCGEPNATVCNHKPISPDHLINKALVLFR